MSSHFDLRLFVRTVVIKLHSLRIRSNIRIRIIYQRSRMALLSIWLSPIIIIDLFPHLILCGLFVNSLDSLTLINLNFILQLALTRDVVVLPKLSLRVVVLLPVQLCRRSTFVGNIVLNLWKLRRIDSNALNGIGNHVFVLSFFKLVDYLFLGR